MRSRRFSLPGRFEWKILAAVFIVATLPLLATGVLLSRTLAAVSAINTRHQQEVRNSLGEALEIYRTTFIMHDLEGYTHTEIAAATGVGVVFGTVPATRAAQMDPVDSLKYE